MKLVSTNIIGLKSFQEYSDYSGIKLIFNNKSVGNLLEINIFLNNLQMTEQITMEVRKHFELW